jgi:hypothetical protein
MAAKKSAKPAVKKRTATPPPPGMGRDETGKRREGGSWRTNARIAAAENRNTKQSGPSRTSGRAPIRGAGKAATTSNVDAMLNREMAGMRGIAKDPYYSSKSQFVQAMTDAIGEGELGRFPGSQWERQAAQKLGSVWDLARGTRGRARR